MQRLQAYILQQGDAIGRRGPAGRLLQAREPSKWLKSLCVHILQAVLRSQLK